MAILFVQGFWNFLIVRRYFNEWVPVVHYHQLLVSRKRVLFWERPKVFTTWANESRCLRNKKKKMISVYVTTPTFQWQFLNISTFHMDEEDSKQVRPFLYRSKCSAKWRGYKAFPQCMLESIRSVIRSPFIWIMCRVLKLLKPYSYTGSNAKRYAQEWYPFEQTTCDQ